MNTIIIIPAFNPDENLIKYVQDLKDAGETKILIVDDGSDIDRKYIFENLEIKENCYILRHAVNMGKGRALKNAFNYCLDKFILTDDGIITVDSDGQHSVEDVLKVKKSLSEHPNSIILGSRDFNQDNVPPKSAFGNKLTKGIIRLLYGGSITDTQTGLRGISFQKLPSFLTLFGERFEYETGVLLEALRENIPIIEVGIKTIYYAENKETHFNPLIDSWKIYKLIFSTFVKYAFSSLGSAVIDMSVFQILLVIISKKSLFVQIWGATIIARIVSSLFNYVVNRNIVFAGNHKGKNTFVKYYSLCICQMCASAALVFFFSDIVELPKLVIKILVDTILFFISFRIQKKGIFGASK